MIFEELCILLHPKVPVQMAMGLKQGYMATLIKRPKVWRYVQVLTIDTNNFVFEVKVISGLESTGPEGYIAKYSHNQ